jgi:hypothetical protein
MPRARTPGLTGPAVRTSFRFSSRTPGLTGPAVRTSFRFSSRTPGLTGPGVRTMSPGRACMCTQHGTSAWHLLHVHSAWHLGASRPVHTSLCRPSTLNRSCLPATAPQLLATRFPVSPHKPAVAARNWAQDAPLQHPQAPLHPFGTCTGMPYSHTRSVLSSDEETKRRALSIHVTVLTAPRW